MLLIPPEAFGIVEASLYRSNALHPVNFPFLKTLNLKTVIVLSPEIPTRAVTTFFEDSGIKFVRIIE